MRALRRTRVSAAGMLALALIVGSSATLSPADAVSLTSSVRAADPAAESAAAELIVAPVNPVAVATDSDVRFRVLIRNGGTTPLPEGSIRLSLGARITDRAPMPEPTPTMIRIEAVGSTEPGKEQSLTISIPMSELTVLTVAERGTYTIHASYVAADAASAPDLTTTTPLVWDKAGASLGTVDLTLIVPFMLPSDIDSMPTRQQLGELAPRFQALLDYAAGVQALLAIDPRIPAAIRGYGTQAPESARTFLANLERSPLQTFLLQFGDADPAAQAALGQAALLGPLGLSFVTRDGAWDEGSGDGANGSGASGAPSLAELMAWPDGIAAAWPADGQVNAETLSLLRAEGVSLTVLRSDNASVQGGPRATLAGSTGADGRPGGAVITDAELDAGLHLELTGASEAERALGAARATARLALAAENGTGGLVVGVDRGGIGDAADPVALLDALTSARWVRTVPLAAQEAGQASVVSAAPDPDRVKALGDALSHEPYVLEARSLLVHPEYLDDYQRTRVLSLFATRYAAPDSGFAAAAKAHMKRDGALHDGVEVIATKHAQLVGASTLVPVQVRNALPFDAAVNITVVPTSAALAISEVAFPAVQLPEDSTERVLVPVQSRVSSGESALLVSVRSADDTYTASMKVLPVSISTTVELIALIVLATAVVLLLGFGIHRSLRRRRLVMRGIGRL